MSGHIKSVAISFQSIDFLIFFYCIGFEMVVSSSVARQIAGYFGGHGAHPAEWLRSWADIAKSCVHSVYVV